jgi:hypothetical protein
MSFRFTEVPVIQLKKLIFFDQKLQFSFLQASVKDVQSTAEALKREIQHFKT